MDNTLLATLMGLGGTIAGVLLNKYFEGTKEREALKNSLTEIKTKLDALLLSFNANDTRLQHLENLVADLRTRVAVIEKP